MSATMSSTSSDTKHQCEICDRVFESYMVLVRDNFTDITDWQKRKDCFDHLCQWCNHMYFKQNWSGRRQLEEDYSD